jgi:hypothetical protein
MEYYLFTYTLDNQISFILYRSTGGRSSDTFKDIVDTPTKIFGSWTAGVSKEAINFFGSVPAAVQYRNSNLQLLSTFSTLQDFKNLYPELFI